jgi:hypothetical protein
MLHKRVSYAKAEGAGGSDEKSKTGTGTRAAGSRTTRFEVIKGGGRAA